MALGTIAAIGGIASGVSSILGGRKAKKQSGKAARQQEQLYRKQADLQAFETEEELRRFDLDRSKTLSTGEALTAASGFSSGSSQDIYLQKVADDLQLERDWTEQVGKQREAITRQGGTYAADTLRSQGDSALWAGIGSGVGSILNGIGKL